MWEARQSTQSNLQVAQQQTVERGAGGGDVAYLPDDPVGWIQTEFYIPENKDKDKLAVQLEPYQQAVLQQALRRDENGHFAYSLVLWSDLKKSAKSVIAAAVVLWLAWHHEWEHCRVVGNDLKQANSRTFFYITRAIELNPRLKAVCKVKQYHIELPNHSQIEAIPVDPAGEAGGGDLIVCFTELWAAKNEAAQRLWTETTLSPLKYGKSLRFCESYAGYIGASPILEQLYEQGVKQGKQVDVGIDGLELYENDAARLLCLWNTIPRCEWQTDEYYAQEAAVLTDSEYQRIHGNQWSQDVETFVPIEWWDACKGDIPELGRYEPLVVALDAAVSGDCFAIVAGSRREDKIYLRHARKWTPPKGGKIDYSNPFNPDDETTPEGFVRWLARTYSIPEFAYDEYQLHDFCSRLMKEGVGFFLPFSQGEDRLVADKQLYDLIRDRRIIHTGDPDVREHVFNANRKQETGDRDKLRIVKRDLKLKIDLCVALSMMCARVTFLNIG